MKQGLVHIYTGPGKGKTCAAIGQAVRMSGHGAKISIWQFLKPGTSGELKALKKFKNIKITSLKPLHPCFSKEKNSNILKQKTLKNLSLIKAAIKKNNFDMAFLDELITCISEGFISEAKVIDFIKTKPKNTELILTGRGASEKLCGIADYVSYIENIKHPYQSSVKARRGIEY